VKKNLLLLLLGFNSFIYAQNPQEFTDLKGDYFGQTPPEDTPVVFAPGIISLSGRCEYATVFSPDGNECYIHRYIGDTSKIYYTRRVNNTWTEQIEAPFSVNQNVTLCSLSADGKKLYFEKDNDIWVVERAAEEWGEPQRLPSPINSDSDDGFYIETADNVAYLWSDRPGGFGNADIWRVRHLSDQSLQAENPGPIVNSTLMQVTPCPAPDGSYLIFAQSVNGYFKLYICFNKGNGEWTAPVDMDKSGADINILQQNSPTLSPDGKYLFFNRHTQTSSGNIADIYWVSTSIIDDIKRAVLPDPNGLIKNISTTQRFSSIQCAIDYASPNEAIIIEPGIYEEGFTLDKDITLQSVVPDDPFYIGSTIIRGNPDEPVVTLRNNSLACTLDGLTLRAGSIGISGTATLATIRNCRIMDNATHGIELSRESNPHLLNCLITGNGQTGITMLRSPGRTSLPCAPIIENCIIVQNGFENIVGGQPVIIDSIIQD
jgi:parallel beta-helix repeat protein